MGDDLRSIDPRVVLILEDDATLASLLGMVMADNSVAALVLDSAESGLKWIRANPGQMRMLISDVNLGGAMTGDALASLVLAETPQTPVVLMSGNQPGDYFPSCTFLRKPFHVEALLAVMRSLI